MNNARFLPLTLFAVMMLALGASDDVSYMDLGRQHCAFFYDGELHKIYQNMSAEMQEALGGEKGLRTFHGQALAQLGREVAIVAETTQEVGGVNVYLRTARFDKVDQLIHVQWAFGENGVVVGFYIRPVQKEAPSEFLDYETRTELELPFEGEWFVFWGGRTLAQNYHAFTEDQRFAYDIVMMKNGSTHRSGGESNADYHCFGRLIFSPASGVVIAVETGVKDNVPGAMNPKQPMGNHVILDHGNGEYSFFAHFKKGSVAVEKGQAVEARDLLGLCGNSGNSSEPHLHYHLQNGPIFQQGKGLPAQFHNYIADGNRVSRGEPVKGQTIRRGP